MTVRFDFATAADIRFGAGRIAEVPRILADLGVTRAFVVTGRSKSRSDGFRAALREVGISDAGFTVPGEPSVDLLREAVAAVDESGSDGVVGYGGGSVLDLAKAVAALAGSGADPLDHLEVVGAGRPLTRPGLPCVTVPTTAGTGSEVTRNSVLSAGGVKASLRSPFLLPKAAVVDPDLLTGLPREVIASSGMDALSQLLEPFLSVRANPVTDALAREGIRRSARSLPVAAEHGMEDPAVRENLALASLFGGLCLANAGLGAVHAFAAAMGARLHAPHGAVCAAVLPAALDVNLRALRSRAPEHPALPRMDEIAVLVTGRPGALAHDAVEWVADLARSLGIPGLRHYQLDETLGAEVVVAAAQASSMKGNPVQLTEAELHEILRRSL